MNSYSGIIQKKIQVLKYVSFLRDVIMRQLLLGYSPGHGHATVQGGAGSRRSEGCSYLTTRYFYGGGGGGGHLALFSPYHIRRDVLRNRDVSGGASAGGSAGRGGTGQICQDEVHCSGHGSYSVQQQVCTCNAGHYGLNCAYKCNASITCLGHGQCSANGGCVCDPGYVGYRCEHRCNATRDCHGKGRCSVTGKCVCDSCFIDDCKLECSGNGDCIGKKCKCNACYLGTHCHSLCSGHGMCSNDSCVCEEGWKGAFCEVPKCPNDCSGNGICNSALLTCFCNPGWTGDDCSEPDCPGEPDCFNRGVCAVINETISKCVNCSAGWMGPACNDPCVHGFQEPMDSGFCKCDACWAGKGCDALCMGRGTCAQSGICDCFPLQGWRGDVCQIPGCPGIGLDCTGHGDCNSATHECTCNPGWAGVGCEIPDCPGAPNCYNRGYCNASIEPPQCQNCSKGWMGPACADPCQFGEQIPMDSGQCNCWPGYSGKGRILNVPLISFSLRNELFLALQVCVNVLCFVTLGYTHGDIDLFLNSFYCCPIFYPYVYEAITKLHFWILLLLLKSLFHHGVAFTSSGRPVSRKN